jgi:hypothetical protein
MWPVVRMSALIPARCTSSRRIPGALADQRLQVDAADSQLPAGAAGGQAGLCDFFLVDEGERRAGLRAVAAEMTVALESLASDREDRFDGR